MSFAALVSLLAPPLCFGCGAAVRQDEPLCRACRAALRWLAPEPVILEGVRAWAPLAYEGPARELVRALKYRGAEALADGLAARIAATAPAAWLHGALVPVPLHPSRRRRRGFNQAERLAAALALRTGLPLADCLVRPAAAAPQVGRRRGERVARLRGRFEAGRGAAVPRSALLVDDVVTTGGTLAACAAALRASGASEVAAVACARTLAR